ncbi:MAG: hypothetical protein AMQ22_01339 [Candidatus Methanofastidiosum methylothiophilum]|uniref:Uncharacterized protein n=1 Tax=Candidatus Methanofastidiosum methylothiophilum TaxID=1705564 RepID=A0A150J277_9EURY|nr:MAG: hypothetical protein AMQ22_01339 [Candidatus Methanofastidiosum methylthiophilus]
MATFGKVKEGQVGLVRIMRESGVPEQYIPYECPQPTDEGTKEVQTNVGDIVRLTDHECSAVPVANQQSYDENIGSGSNVSITNNDCPNNLNGNNQGNNPLAFLEVPKSCYCEQVAIGGTLRTIPWTDSECKIQVYQYLAYEHILGEPDYIWTDDVITMNMRVHHYTNNRGFQVWYPSGGIWIGVHGKKTKKWYWYDAADPYLIIRNGPPFYTYYPPDSHITTDPGGQKRCTDGGSGIAKYRVENFLIHFNLPSNEAIDVIHIHISNNSTLLWTNFVRARLTYFSLCRMNPKSPFTRIFDDVGEDMVTRNEDISQATNPDNKQRVPMPGRYPM